MEDFIKFVLVVLVVILACTLGPALFIWAVNSLAELGGADFYITHSIWSYWVAFVFLVVIKASKS